MSRLLFIWHEGRGFTLLLPACFTIKAQSAWTIPCPLFTISFQAAISLTAAILDSSKIAPCPHVGHEGKDVVAMRVRDESFLLTDLLRSVLNAQLMYRVCTHCTLTKLEQGRRKKKNSLKVTLKWTFFNNIEHFLRHFTNICLWPTHLWQLFASIFYFHQFQAGGNKLLDTISVMTLSEGQVIEEYSHFFWTICTNYFEYV